jgi:hypothetical protein
MMCLVWRVIVSLPADEQRESRLDPSDRRVCTLDSRVAFKSRATRIELRAANGSTRVVFTSLAAACEGVNIADNGEEGPRIRAASLFASSLAGEAC